METCSGQMEACLQKETLSLNRRPSLAESLELRKQRATQELEDIQNMLEYLKANPTAEKFMDSMRNIGL